MSAKDEQEQEQIDILLQLLEDGDPALSPQAQAQPHIKGSSRTIGIAPERQSRSRPSLYHPPNQQHQYQQPQQQHPPDAERAPRRSTMHPPNQQQHQQQQQPPPAAERAPRRSSTAALRTGTITTHEERVEQLRSKLANQPRQLERLSKIEQSQMSQQQQQLLLQHLQLPPQQQHPPSRGSGTHPTQPEQASRQISGSGTHLKQQQQTRRRKSLKNFLEVEKSKSLHDELMNQNQAQNHLLTLDDDQVEEEMNRQRLARHKTHSFVASQLSDLSHADDVHTRATRSRITTHQKLEIPEPFDFRKFPPMNEKQLETFHELAEEGRSLAAVPTESTLAQTETEEECSPYFVHIPSLPPNQLTHLQSLGLLQSYEFDEKIMGARAFEEVEHLQYDIVLLRKKHAAYLLKNLTTPLNANFTSLDASRPWMIYWITHSLDLLGCLPDDLDLHTRIFETIKGCFSDVRVVDLERNDGNGGSVGCGRGGGFGGGMGQLPHVATTYGAILSLVILSTGPISHQITLYLNRIRPKLYTWFLSLRTRLPHVGSGHSRSHVNAGMEGMDDTDDYNGVVGYRVHHDGEIDVRSSYLILSVAKLLNILTVELTRGIREWIVACQTYEGGLSAEPQTGEAHGGYTYCGIASLRILGEELEEDWNDGDEDGEDEDGLNHTSNSNTPRSSFSVNDNFSHSSSHRRSSASNDTFDMEALRGWLSRRQTGYEGGFSGRANKLVDGCYSFWQGGGMAIVNLMEMDGNVDGTESGCVASGSERNSTATTATTASTTTDRTTHAHGNHLHKKKEAPAPHKKTMEEEGVGATNTNTNPPTEFSPVNPLYGFDSRKDQEDEDDCDDALLFHRGMLQRYILMCAQVMDGGFRDKPSKGRDFYHTCYNLSGLSVCQHVLSKRGLPNVYGHAGENVLRQTHPTFNVVVDKAQYILNYF